MTRSNESDRAGVRAETATGDAPRTTAEALARARHHGRAAAAEALLAVRALLDAAALASSGTPAEAHGALGTAARSLAGLAEGLAPDGADGALALVHALSDALDREIARWEKRASEDPEARSVLRAFLGVREILWEMGVRRSEPGGDPKPEPPAARTAKRGRVQRVRVQG